MANNRPTKYLQTDPKWKSVRYSTNQENATIGGSGCGPTAMAMAIAYWKDKSVTPVTTCAWAQSHGYKATGAGTYHSYFVPQAKVYGLECYRVNTESIQYMSAATAAKYHNEAHAAVSDGNLVICLMGKGNWTRGGHYILWYDNDGNDVLINDPASTKATRERNTFALLKSQVRFYWVIKVPKEVISMTNTEVKALIKSEVQAQATTVANAAINAYISNRNNSPDVGDWAKEAWDKSQKKIGKNEKPIMDGSAPKGYITREQVATIMDRLGMFD